MTRQLTLRRVLRQNRTVIWVVGLFSFFVNLLMLTGPLYMLNIYDRVLQSRSVETLVALTLIAVFLFGVMGVLDHLRGRIMARIGAGLQQELEPQLFCIGLRRAVVPDKSASVWRDLDHLHRVIASPGAMAL
ncbi:MAG: type I secretion system permease/ATPase, partial [Loktanella sp.]|nr:type I secretion system permease/ATPase [Loktanella sp.]